MSIGDAAPRGNHARWRVTSAGLRQWFLDSCAWAVAFVLAALFRFDFAVVRFNVEVLVFAVIILVIAQFFLGIGSWLYQGRYESGSLEEFAPVAWVVAIETVVFGLVMVFTGRVLGIPRSILFIAAPIALCLMLAVRYIKRLLNDHRHDSVKAGGRHALIFGAGSLGTMTIQRLLADTRSPYLPVGILDDNPAAVNRSVRTARVLGKLEDLGEVAARLNAAVLIVAIADLEPKQMKRVMDVASAAGVEVKVVPTLASTLGGPAEVGDIRDIKVEDLLERPPVELDLEAIAKYLAGKRVLVTGAGGSIGQELCVQIDKHGPRHLVMVDHDETHLQDTEFARWQTGLLVNPEIVLADIRDAEAMRQVFEKWRPEVVFHAAALKHVPMLQSFPREAWETNVLGTLNVLECARAVGTGVFINISTDKAANPTTVLGHSKRLAECLTSWMGEQTGMRYCSVRFGNVIGSRGSAVPLFQKRIDRGLPILLTHREATRYFMTIPEACQLVIQAGASGARGDVLILDMGSPVKMYDIATRLIEISGKKLKIEFTGLREGEKLHEILFSQDEADSASSTVNRTVRASVPTVDPVELDYEAWVAEVECESAHA